MADIVLVKFTEDFAGKIPKGYQIAVKCNGEPDNYQVVKALEAEGKLEPNRGWNIDGCWEVVE